MHGTKCFTHTIKNLWFSKQLLYQLPQMIRIVRRSLVMLCYEFAGFWVGS